MQQEQLALTDWVAAKGFTVFGTLKFTDGFNIHDTLAEKLVRKYFSALDRAYYGNAVTNNNVRHNRAVFLHKGSSQQNTHYHFLAKPNTDSLLFCKLARKQWAGLDTHTMGFLDTHIGLVQNNNAAAGYMLHEYKKLGSSTLFTAATHISTSNVPAAKYRSIHQLRRLLKLDSFEYDKIFRSNGDGAVEHIAA